MSCRSVHSVLVGLVCLAIASAICGSSVASSSFLLCLESERDALLQFKQGLVDVSNSLASWKNETDCCEWRGIACNNQTGHVITLDLSYTFDSYLLSEVALSGEISPSLLELRYLSYLDLSQNDFGGMMIPQFIGSLSRLKELRLANAQFTGSIPPQLGNLSNMQTLDLSTNQVSIENLDWLSRISSLRYLTLSGLDFSNLLNWPQFFSKFTSLTELQLSNCYLPDVNLRSLSSINSSTSLQLLDLSNNNLNSSIFYWMANVSSNLVHVDLSFNNLEGPTPDVFRSMLSLVTLDLSTNQLEAIPKSFQNLCSLESLDFQSNQLSENIEDFFKTLYCAGNTIETLDLRNNQFWGSLPDLKPFSKLRVVYLGSNHVNGSLPESFGQLSSLEVLSLSGNSLSGVITETHLLNLSRLQSLDVSDNHFSINLTSDWNPPFQLDNLDMSSCKVDSAFPKWIQKQRNLSTLHLSNAGISGTLPNEFRNLFVGLEDLDLSMNQIHGKLPNMSSKLLGRVNVSNNLFSGAVPSFSPNLNFLYLKDNMFSGSLSSLCAPMTKFLSVLDMSENLLSGELPNCMMQFGELQVLLLGKNKFSGMIPSWLGNLKLILVLSLNGNNFLGELPSLENCARLSVVDLGDNNLSGKIPTWIGNLKSNRILRLHQNNFSGEFPALENNTELTVVDLGDNNLSGKIPTWMGKSLTNLIVLRLRSNEFNGVIPFSMCSLAKIHVLDLSHNKISGGLPHCLSNISALAINDIAFADVIVEVELVWKGIATTFGKNLAGMRSIDMSSNNFIGEIPRSIASMTELISLNLSRNCLNGKLPENFGNMKMLESLDLSRNKISGEIPASFSSLNYLGVLDVSHNQLSGRIPLGTQLQSFSASAYMGNLGLCGQPLTPSCTRDGTTTQDGGITKGSVTDNKEHDNGSVISLGLVISTTLGFITGFWVVCGSLLLKSSWRYAYFKLVDDSRDWVYVKAAPYKAKIQRRRRR